MQNGIAASTIAEVLDSETISQAKVNAIDNGQSIETAKIDAESGEKRTVEFKGNEPKPTSKDSEIEALQLKYTSAQSGAANAQRRLGQANEGKFDDDPKKKQFVIDHNTKLLNESNAEMAALEAQLKAKGASPV
jgi:hypothetical protein